MGTMRGAGERGAEALHREPQRAPPRREFIEALRAIGIGPDRCAGGARWEESADMGALAGGEHGSGDQR